MKTVNANYYILFLVLLVLLPVAGCFYQNRDTVHKAIEDRYNAFESALIRQDYDEAFTYLHPKSKLRKFEDPLDSFTRMYNSIGLPEAALSHERHFSISVGVLGKKAFITIPREDLSLIHYINLHKPGDTWYIYSYDVATIAD